MLQAVAASSFILLFGTLAGSPRSALWFVAFILAIPLPAWWLLRDLSRRAGIATDLAAIVAAIVVIFLMAPVYILRKQIGSWQGPFDLTLTALLWSLVFVRHGWRDVLPAIREMVPPPARLWVLLAFPLLAVLTWSGFAVRQDGVIKFFGVHFVDSGNLAAITNLVRVSPGLPLWSFGDARPLSYHWLFFVFPAWASEFGFSRIETWRSLALANLAAAGILYLSVALAAHRVLSATRVPRQWVAHTAGIAMLCGSTLYAYQSFGTKLGITWLGTGTRNHLLLQMPLSLAVFGNNTVALAIALVVVELLASWNETGEWPYLLVAAGLVPLIAGYSVTLLFAVALAIGVGAILGHWARPALLLGVFVLMGALGIGALSAANLFSHSQASGIRTVFDGGQFARNILFGFLPSTGALIFALWRTRAWGRDPLVLLSLSAILVPTFLVTTGTSTAAVDMSMKNASLFLAGSAPLLAATMVWAVEGRRESRAVLAVVGTVLLAGALNSGAFALRNPLSRLGLLKGAHHGMGVDHYDALRFISQSTPPDSILIDGISVDFDVANPALMIGGRRVLVGAAHERTERMMTPTDRRHLASWESWRRGGFLDDRPGGELARNSDILLVDGEVVSQYWERVRSFGSVRVYRSNVRRAIR